MRVDAVFFDSTKASHKAYETTLPYHTLNFIFLYVVKIGTCVYVKTNSGIGEVNFCCR